MSVRLAHISDLHIVSNTANLEAVFWDFLLLVGPPAAAMPFLKPYLDDPEKRKQLWKTLFYRTDSEKIDYKKVAAVAAMSLPAALFIVRQLVRLKRIFYLRKDAEVARLALLEDLQRQKVDQVVITGDITNTANDVEFEIALDFLKKLASFTKIMLIPGNHDVDVQRLISGKAGKLDRYSMHLGGFLASPGFPMVHRLGEVCLVGLDSTTFNPVANSRGEVSEEQLDRINDDLNQPDIRGSYKVLVLHHHVLPAPREKRVGFKVLDKLVGLGERYFMHALRNADRVLSLAADHKVGLVLHGHKHMMYQQEEDDILLDCAGATTTSIEGEIKYRIYQWKGGDLSSRECRVKVS